MQYEIPPLFPFLGTIYIKKPYKIITADYVTDNRKSDCELGLEKWEHLI